MNRYLLIFNNSELTFQLAQEFGNNGIAITEFELIIDLSLVEIILRERAFYSDLILN